MTEFTRSIVSTPRLDMNVWTSGPEDGLPLLLVHGNLSSGGFWKYLAAELPADVRVIAPDMRAFGRTEAKTVDATRGLGDMSDDVHGLLEVLGLGGRPVNSVGWSMGAGVLMQQLLENPGDLASMIFIAPLSPFGFGGTTDAKGTMAYSDGAGTGAGGANPEFVRRLLIKDDTEMVPLTSPRVMLRTYFGPERNAKNVDEDFLVEELLRVKISDQLYPGNSVPSMNWPLIAPGDKGVNNAMSPKYFDTSAIVDLPTKPPVTWIFGSDDQISSNRSMFDFGTLGMLGAVPGWPGPMVFPPQPMEDQMRFVLKEYAQRGGQVREVPLEGVGHGIPLAVPGRLAEEVVASLVR
ncbi:alpha/beta hydrolase [Granulicoccus sp. GXG6511]|uniref:alpha/beta hydrolase n=1 Tax=Granulicoccus sp. GXG6511 TaxID=3381351 RepID=UPI003D7E7BCD